MTHCTYCGKETEETYCSEECKQKVESFERKVQKNAKWLIIGCVLSMAIMPISYAVGRPYLAILCLAGVGMVFLIFPYGSPTTNSWGGVKKGCMYVRIVAIALCIISVMMSYLFSI